ncbi:APC family permease [Novipirellula sp. SH528]|uniref:APC family permease n=1 Tax=Novipirellula sp. SH528 TaxID=3454466 RepID=UPI003FA08831
MANTPRPAKLGQLASTAICGNDITSSCLYVSALAIGYGGRWAPVCLVLVAATLYLFRSIYAEVVGALPLNGGAYNALLNTTSKYRASIAACLTVLSYMATAVISSNEAMHYLHSIWNGLPIIAATIALLAFFMILSIIGITESSKLAIGIFLFHLTSMVLLIILGVFAVTSVGTEVLWNNLKTPGSDGFGPALFFGFAAAMLGISGFESSANFVEEQADGVFPKTLRNMWIAVTLLNPGMALLALALVPIIEVREQFQNDLLSHMGHVAGGDWLSWLIGIDAVLVLSGATLTSYVGVTGLVKRMTLDRCLPSFLLKENRRKTPHRIIMMFFALSVSVLLITHGELKSLAAVYTLSFLSVMILFAIGNLLLKVKRAKLPRPSSASYLTVLLAMAAVGIAIMGNAKLNQHYLIVFLEYLVPTVLVVTLMLTRVQILELLVFFLDEVRGKITREKQDAMEQNDRDSAAWWGILTRRLNQFDKRIHNLLDHIRSQRIVFFTRGDNLPNLNKVIQYIQDNEHTERVKLVTLYEDEVDIPPRLIEHVRFLDETYPEIDIEYVKVKGEFTPERVASLAKEWNIPTNLMFIGSPSGASLKYRLEEFGGVRLII